VPYKGSGPALVDFVAGRVQMMLTTIAALQPQVDAGQLRALAVTGSQPGKGGVPTFESMGYKEFNPIELVTMILAPKELPLAVTNKLADGMSKTLEMPDVRKAIETQNQQPFFIGPKELAERLRNDRAKFADIVEKGHIKLTDA
jgi:tripartite-type tricarboxylate transporter receptor subunit TctC